MKIKKIYMLLFLFALTSSAFAYNWSAAGFQEISSGVDDDENYLILKDENSVTIKIRFHDEAPGGWEDKVVELNKKFTQWEYMKSSAIDYLVTSNSLEVLINPTYFTYNNSDFLQYMPGGMTFILYDYGISYNFRITKDNIFLRLNDKFIDEVSLCKRIKEALDDPIMYLKKREPEYLLQKLNELEGDIALLKMYHDRLANSVLYLHNTGALGFGNTPVKSSLIKKVVELKTKEPALTLDKIKEQLDKEKVDYSNKELKLILNIFYNEFN
ncbi:MAG: coiled-coil domain-containing family 149 protein [Leptospirales bacterium]|nr:coiled-coil domain-containing family 149 protein [Leptospirales bacterium]